MQQSARVHANLHACGMHARSQRCSRCTCSAPHGQPAHLLVLPVTPHPRRRLLVVGGIPAGVCRGPVQEEDGTAHMASRETSSRRLLAASAASQLPQRAARGRPPPLPRPRCVYAPWPSTHPPTKQDQAVAADEVEPAAAGLGGQEEGKLVLGLVVEVFDLGTTGGGGGNVMQVAYFIRQEGSGKVPACAAQDGVSCCGPADSLQRLQPRLLPTMLPATTKPSTREAPTRLLRFLMLVVPSKRTKGYPRSRHSCRHTAVRGVGEGGAAAAAPVSRPVSRRGSMRWGGLQQ